MNEFTRTTRSKFPAHRDYLINHDYERVEKERERYYSEFENEMLKLSDKEYKTFMLSQYDAMTKYNDGSSPSMVMAQRTADNSGFKPEDYKGAIHWDVEDATENLQFNVPLGFRDYVGNGSRIGLYFNDVDFDVLITFLMTQMMERIVRTREIK